MATLNTQQKAIVEYVVKGEGSANVVARAGCGKTYTLVNGVVTAIVDNGLGSAVLMAFNKSAADEFESRIAKLGSKYQIVDTGTVHSLGFRAWRKGRSVKVDGFKVWSIVREYDAKSDDKENIFAKHGAAIVKLVSLAKQSGIGIVNDIDDIRMWAGLIEHYDVDTNGSEEAIIDAAIDVLIASTAQGDTIIDFDDMIYLPLVHNVPVNQYDFVLIDEAQDTNLVRRLLAFKMMKPNGRLIAVGDDKQAIYGFSGANSDSLELIRRELNSVILPLTLTYRCPKSVVKEANRLVPDLTADESAPIGAVRNLEWRNYENGAVWYESEAVDFNDVALCRNTKPLIAAAYSMIAANKACRVEGRDIGEGLIALATKWKTVKTLAQLQEKVAEWSTAEIEKWTKRHADAKVQLVEDKVETLNIIIDNLTSNGAETVVELVAHIRGLFGDTPSGEKPKVFTLSTVHKAKGLEWDRVYLLSPELIPSKYAKQDWQIEQEDNLLYVAITRSKNEFIYVHGSEEN